MSILRPAVLPHRLACCGRGSPANLPSALSLLALRRVGLGWRLSTRDRCRRVRPVKVVSVIPTAQLDQHEHSRGRLEGWIRVLTKDTGSCASERMSVSVREPPGSEDRTERPASQPGRTTRLASRLVRVFLLAQNSAVGEASSTQPTPFSPNTIRSADPTSPSIRTVGSLDRCVSVAARAWPVERTDLDFLRAYR